jgi:RimJ/RimL family protein N-acetyltransferase
MRYWHRPAIARLAVVEEMVREQIAAQEICRYWTVWRGPDAIGSCDLSLIEWADMRAQTGFLFRRDQWGHGFAREAMAAVAAHAFEVLELDLLIAKTHAQNAAARRVLERLGFEREQIAGNYAPAPRLKMDCAFYTLHRD